MARALSSPSPRPPMLREAELNSFFWPTAGPVARGPCDCVRCDGRRPSVVVRFIGGIGGGGGGLSAAGRAAGCALSVRAQLGLARLLALIARVLGAIATSQVIMVLPCALLKASLQAVVLPPKLMCVQGWGCSWAVESFTQLILAVLQLESHTLLDTYVNLGLSPRQLGVDMCLL